MLTNEGWNNSQSCYADHKEKDEKLEKVEHKDEKCHDDPCNIKECYHEDKTMCKCDHFISDASKAMVYALQLQKAADATADKSLEEKDKAEELSKKVSHIAKEITPVLDEAIKFYDMAYGLADKAINELLKASKCFDECPSLDLCPALDKCKDKCKHEYEDSWEDKNKDKCKDSWEDKHEDEYEDKCEGKFKYKEKYESNHKDKCKDEYEDSWEDKNKDKCKDKYEDEYEHNKKDKYEWKPVSGSSICEELVDVVKCLQRKAKCLEKLADKKEEEARELLCKANEADKVATDAFERAYNLIQKAFSIDNFANKVLSDAYALGLKAYDCCKDSKRKVDKDHEDNECYCNFEFGYKDKGNSLLCKCDQFIIELNELVCKAKKINEKADCELKEACEQLEIAKKAAKATEILREKANKAIIEVAKINNEVAKLQNKAYKEAIKAYKCFKCCAKQGRFGYNHDCDCCERFVKEAECLIEKSNEALKKANCKIEEAIKLSHIVSEVQKKEFDAWNKAICLINEAFNQNAKAQDTIYCSVIPNLIYGYQCCKAD